MSVQLVEQETKKPYIRCGAVRVEDFMPFWEHEFGSDFLDPSTKQPFSNSDIIFQVSLDLPETERRFNQIREFCNLEYDFDSYRRTDENLVRIMPAVKEHARRPKVNMTVNLPRPTATEVAAFLCERYAGFNLIFTNVSGDGTPPPLTPAANATINGVEKRSFLEEGATPEERVARLLRQCREGSEADPIFKQKVINAWRRYLESLYGLNQTKAHFYEAEQAARDSFAALIKATEHSHFVCSSFFFGTTYHFKGDRELLGRLKALGLGDEDYIESVAMLPQAEAPDAHPRPAI